jgi:hypothetical protein
MVGITKDIGSERLSNCGDPKCCKYQDHVGELPVPQIQGYQKRWTGF